MTRLMSLIVPLLLISLLCGTTQAQPAPQTLQWWISFAPGEPGDQKDKMPSVNCQNGVPVKTTFSDLRYFDNLNVAVRHQKMFVVEQLVPRPESVTLPNGQTIQQVKLVWVVKGQTEAKSWQVKTYSCTAFLEHNNGYPCKVRARGIYREFDKIVDGVFYYKPWKVGDTGVTWLLVCGGPPTKVPGNQGVGNQ